MKQNAPAQIYFQQSGPRSDNKKNMEQYAREKSYQLQLKRNRVSVKILVLREI